jgi:hypothetical protein
MTSFAVAADNLNNLGILREKALDNARGAVANIFSPD